MVELAIVSTLALIGGTTAATGVARLLMTTMKVGKHPVVVSDIPDEEVQVDSINLDEE